MKNIKINLLTLCTIMPTLVFGVNLEIKNNTPDPLDVKLYDKKGKKVFSAVVPTNKSKSFKNRKISVSKITWQNKFLMGQEEAKKNPLFKGQKFQNKEKLTKLGRISGDHNIYELKIDIDKTRKTTLTLLPQGEVEVDEKFKGKRSSAGSSDLLKKHHSNNNNNNNNHGGKKASANL